MSGEGGNIIRNVFGKSYKEAESITIDARKGPLNFRSPHENTFHGKKGGGKFDNYTDKNDTILLVKKLKGPIDVETNKIVDIIEKDKKYRYEGIEFNREPTKAELKALRWGLKFDDGEILEQASIKGSKAIFYTVPKNLIYNKISVYAYFVKPSEAVSIKASLLKEELLVFIATEQYYNDNAANKLMFSAQAVRLVRTKLSKELFLKVAMFTDGYTENQLNAVANAILNYNKNATFIRINTVDQVINLINSGSRDSSAIDPKRRVKEIYAFSHGIVRDTNEGVIAFGYNGKNYKKQELDNVGFSNVKKEVFLENNKTNFYSYACRTGIGTASETTSDPVKINSLAQKMANHGKITVYAYMRRSQYEYTWGTSAHRNAYASDNDSEETTLENLKADIKDVMNSEPNDMDAFTKYRKKEVKIDGASWNPEGAYMGVKEGNQPMRVPSTYDKYVPN